MILGSMQTYDNIYPKLYEFKVELSVQQRNATTDSGQCWNKDYGKLNLKYNAVDH